MPSLLASQLSKISDASTSNSNLKPSLLLDKKQSKQWDKEAFLSLGRSGLTDLISMNPDFESFQDSLFSNKALQSDRMLMTNEENALLNSLLRDFLLHLSPYFLQSSSLKVLEWLIHHFRIYEFNVKELMGCIIPYHETKQFVLVVSTLLLSKGSQWEFLNTVQKSQVPLDRTTLVRRLKTDSSILSFTCELLSTYKKKNIVHRPLNIFFNMTVLEYIQSMPSLREEDVRLLMPTLISNFKSNRSETMDLSASCMMIVTLMGAKAPFDSSLLSSILEASVKGLSLENLSSTLVMMMNLYEFHPQHPLTFKALAKFMEFKDEFVKEFNRISSLYSCLEFTRALLSTLFEAFMASQDSKESQEFISCFSSLLNCDFMKLDFYSGLVKSLCETLIGSIESPSLDSDKFTSMFTMLHSFAQQDMDSILNANLIDSNPHFKALYSLVAPLLKGTLSEPLPNLGTSLYLGLYDSFSKKRFVALQVFIQNLQETTQRDFTNDQIETILMDRLRDDDASIVKMVLNLGKELQVYISRLDILVKELISIHIHATIQNSTLALLLLVSLYEMLDKESQTQVLGLLLSRLFIFKNNSNTVLGLVKALEETRIESCSFFTTEIKKIKKDLKSLEPLEYNKKLMANISTHFTSLGQLECFEYGLNQELDLQLQSTSCLVLNYIATNVNSDLVLALLVKYMTSPLSCTSTNMFSSLKWKWKWNLENINLENQDFVNGFFSRLDLIPSLGKLWTLVCLVKSIQSSKVQDWFFDVNQVESTSMESTIWILFEYICNLSLSSSASTSSNGLFKGMPKSVCKEWTENLLALLFSRIPIDGCVAFCCNVIYTSRTGSLVEQISKCISLQVLESFIKSWKSFIDLQVLLPCLVYACGQVNRNTRKCAIQTLETLSNFYTCHSSKESKESIIYKHDSFYGPKSSQILFLKTKRVNRFILDLLVHKEEIKMDSHSIQVILKSLLESKSNSDILSCLNSVILVLNSTTMQSQLLNLLSLVDVSSKYKSLDPLLKKLLDLEKHDSNSLTLISRILSTLTVKIIGSVYSKASIHIYKILDAISPYQDVQDVQGEQEVQDVNGQITIAELILNQIQPLWFASLDLTQQQDLCNHLFRLLSKDVSGLSLKIKQLISVLELSAEHFIPCLNGLTDNLNTPYENNSKKSKGSPSHMSGLSGKEKKSLHDLVVILELLEMISNTRNTSVDHTPTKAEFTQLIPCCFQLLIALLGMESSVLSLEYAKQLLLSLLNTLFTRNLASKTPKETRKEIQESQVNVECIIQCIRVTDNTSTHNLAFLCLSSISQMYPHLVLKSIMPIFTFMGTNVLRQDDDFSFHVIQKAIGMLVPLTKSVNGHSLEIQSILDIFVDALGHIPRHKRLQIFKILVLELGKQEDNVNLYLSRVLQMILSRSCSSTSSSSTPSSMSVSSTKERNEYDFSNQLICEFDLQIIIKTFGNLMDSFISSLSQEDEVASKEQEETLEKQGGKAFEFLHHQITSKRFIQLFLSSHQPHETELIHLIQNILLIIPKLPIGSSDSSRLYECLVILLDLTSIESYLDIILTLLDHSNLNVSCKAIMILTDKIKALDFTSETCTLFLPVIDKLCLALQSTTLDQKKQVLLDCLGQLGRFMSASHPDVFVSSMDLLVSKDALMHKNVQVSCCAMIAIAHVTFGIGPRILVYLNKILSFVNSTIESVLIDSSVSLNGFTNKVYKETQETQGKQILTICFTVCKSMIHSIPRFTSPFVSKWIQYVISPSFISLLKEFSRDFLESLAANVSPRVLLPCFMQLLNGTFESKDVLSITSLFEFVVLVIQQMNKADFVEFLPDLTKFYLHGMDLRVLSNSAVVPMDNSTQQSNKNLSNVQVDEAEESILNSLVVFIMKLNDSYFKPLFLKLLDWATLTLSIDQLSRKDQMNRKIVFFRFLNLFMDKTRNLGVSYYSYTLDSSISLLNSLESLVKEQQVTPEQLLMSVNFLLGSLTKYFMHSQGVMDQTKFEKIHTPLMNAMTIMKECCSMDSPQEYMTCMTEYMIPCIAQLAVYASSETQRKALNRSVCMNTRHADPLIRLASVCILREFYTKLGEDMLVYFPETIPFIAELMEDDDEDVDNATQMLCMTIQEYVGEDIQHYFNGE